MTDEDRTEESRIARLEGRVDALEEGFEKLRGETRDGFSRLDEKFDKTIAPVVQEKVKWGDTLRDVATWTARTILLGCLAAMGMQAYKIIFGG